MLRSVSLSFAVAFSLWHGWALQAYGQSSYDEIIQEVIQLDRAVCLQQWEQAIDITGELIASPNVSSDYRQELLKFRQQLQIWQVNSRAPTPQSSCDRTSRHFLNLPELDDTVEPLAHLIPPELTTSSPDVLTDFVTPIDTADGFHVLGNRLNHGQQVYSLLARLGDQLSLDVDVTRNYISGAPQVFLFDSRGHLLTQNHSSSTRASIQDFVIPKTDVYFAAVSSQGGAPILDTRGVIMDWQSIDSQFDYTLTLTGITPYQTLLP